MSGHSGRSGKRGSGNPPGRGSGSDFRSGGSDRRGELLGAALAALGSGKSSGGKGPDGHGVGNDNAGQFGVRGQPLGRDGIADGERRSRLPKFGLGAAFVALVLWTLFAWVGYGLADSILAWLSSNAGVIVQSGKDAAAATGIGKDVIGAVDSAQTTGFLGGLVGLVGVVLRPLIVVVWALGAAFILAVPWLISLLRRRF